MMPALKSCCFCCTTRTGTLILGVFSLIASVSSSLIIIAILAMWNTITEVVKEAVSKKDAENIFTIDRSHEMWQYLNEENVDFFLTIMLDILIVSLIFTLVGIVIDSILIHGVRKMIPSLMLPFLIMYVINIVLNVISNIYWMAKFGNILAGIIFLLIFLTISIYFLLVIISHYQELRNRNGKIRMPDDSKFKYEEENSKLF